MSLSSDLVLCVIAFVAAPNLRVAALLGHDWSTGVKLERRLRLKAPRTQTVLLGGGRPDLMQYGMSTPIRRADVVGGMGIAIPSPPKALQFASAVILSDGRIVLCGSPPNSILHLKDFFSGRHESIPLSEFFMFCPVAWRWSALPVLGDRDRRCIKLASDDGVRVLALGGYVGDAKCKLTGHNTSPAVDALKIDSSWKPLADLASPLMNPVIVSPHRGSPSPLQLILYRSDDGEVVNSTLSWSDLTMDDHQFLCPLRSIPEHVDCATGAWITEDVFMISIVADAEIKVYVAKPRWDWVLVCTMAHEQIAVELFNPPTIARWKDCVLVSAVFCDVDDQGSVVSSVGWYAAELSALVRYVEVTGADAAEWRDVTCEVGTPVREGCAAVLLPAY